MWRYLDPDTRVFSRDKFEHFGGCLGFTLILLFIGFSPPAALLLTMLVGAVFELGQVDTARNLSVMTRDGRPLLGQPGFGFGLLDLAWDIVGALVAIGIWSVL